MRCKKNYAMVKLKGNSRTFVVRYKRIRRGELPPNIVMRRTYTQRLRQEVEDVEERNKDKEFLNL